MSTQATQAQPVNERKPKKRPEVKFGRVAVWQNSTETQEGVRMFRSVSISPRRFQDAQDKWRDAPGFRADELGSLIVALQKALDYLLTTPIQGHEHDDEDAEPIPF